MNNNYHIELAIKQAKKEKNKGVQGFVGTHDDHIKYSKLISEGILETFVQEYEISGFKLSCLLLREIQIIDEKKR